MPADKLSSWMPDVVPRANRMRVSPVVSMGAAMPRTTADTGAGGDPARPPRAHAKATKGASRLTPRMASRVTGRIDRTPIWGWRSITGGKASSGRGWCCRGDLGLSGARPRRPGGTERRQRRGPPWLWLPLEHDQHDGVRLSRHRADDAERLTAAVF